MKYKSLSLYSIPELVIPIRISLRKFYVHHDLNNHFMEYICLRTDLFVVVTLLFSSFIICYQIFNKSNMEVVTSGTGTVYFYTA
jgi:hypothetical protein